MNIVMLLKKAQLAGELVSIYFDCDDWGVFSLGTVDAIDDNYVRIRAYSKYGEPDGYEIRELADIVKIETRGQYENRVSSLIQAQGGFFEEVSLDRKKESDLIVDTLTAARDSGKMVCLWGRDSEDSIEGFVDKISDDLVSVKLIDQFGREDGISTLKIDQVAAVDFNTREQQARNYLSQVINDSLGK